ncbi:hypothetical protein SAMN05421676_105149 [Salinibacillus kushneri]|uniref:DUF4083 domain-containing protein n=1 Tax=Salinibacillus kushneri TaxID=237682 RepID=A0A1I0F2T4_9BACI|nr:DUF4083 family protein [Salinibacillus kushneri]SET51310.1 hypothetical protein SAMN05421676_105149 [Salinibacillus kushneri]
METLGSFGWMLLINIVFIMLIAFIFYGVRSFFIKPKNDGYYHYYKRNKSGENYDKELKNLNQKLDKIIELLEKEKQS